VHPGHEVSDLRAVAARIEADGRLLDYATATHRSAARRAAGLRADLGAVDLTLAGIGAAIEGLRTETTPRRWWLPR
jgi:hypothetical protein